MYTIWQKKIRDLKASYGIVPFPGRKALALRAVRPRARQHVFEKETSHPTNISLARSFPGCRIKLTTKIMAT